MGLIKKEKKRGKRRGESAEGCGKGRHSREGCVKGWGEVEARGKGRDKGEAWGEGDKARWGHKVDRRRAVLAAPDAEE